jgi:copper chaperone CopZ
MAETLTRRVDLELEGMSCAACAARIERSLNELEGVDATVNFATEKAPSAMTNSLRLRRFASPRERT